MPPFRVGKVTVKPFGQGVDGVVGKVDAANHRSKFGKPTVPRKRRV
jgi:hypothetical protein